jgi:ElaA protein
VKTQNSQITWTVKHFIDLTPRELYDILQLRESVFIVEQNCPYLDADGKDVQGFHVMGYDNSNLVATSRLLPQEISYNEISIGRVASHSDYRMSGIGKELMKQSLQHCELIFGKQAIRIGAQKYLKRFYENFGFVDIGKEYLEDGIPHLVMLRNVE